MLWEDLKNKLNVRQEFQHLQPCPNLLCNHIWMYLELYTCTPKNSFELCYTTQYSVSSVLVTCTSWACVPVRCTGRHVTQYLSHTHDYSHWAHTSCTWLVSLVVCWSMTTPMKRSICPKQVMYAVEVVALGIMSARCVNTALTCWCGALRVRMRRAALCAGICCQFTLQLANLSLGLFSSQVHGVHGLLPFIPYLWS